MKHKIILLTTISFLMIFGFGISFVFALSCGSATQQSWSTAPTTNLCVDAYSSGTPFLIYEGQPNAAWAWSCWPSPDGEPILCFAPYSSSPLVNGACGSSNGQTLTSAPSTNLCSAGTASSVTSGTSAYTWTCNGSSGGTNASCSATRNYIVEYSATYGSCTPSSRTVAYGGTSIGPTCTPNPGYYFVSFTGLWGGRRNN